MTEPLEEAGSRVTSGLRLKPTEPKEFDVDVSPVDPCLAFGDLR